MKDLTDPSIEEEDEHCFWWLSKNAPQQLNIVRCYAVRAGHASVDTMSDLH